MPPKKKAVDPQEALVQRIWNDPATGFAGAPVTHKRAKAAAAAEGLPFTLKVEDVRKILAKNDAVQLNSRVLPVKHFAHFRAPGGINSIHQLDLLDLNKQGFGAVAGGNRYLVISVDVYSRLGVGTMIRNKDAKSVLAAWTAITALAPYDGPAFRPQKISTDSGGEYALLKRQAKKELIEYVAEDAGVHTKLAVANNFHQRLEKRLAVAARTISGKKTGEWEALIPALLHNINTSENRSLGATPAEVYAGEKEPKNEGGAASSSVLSEQELREQEDIKLGTRVRIIVGPNTFKRAYFERWGDETYVVLAVRTVDDSGLERYQLYSPDTAQVLPNLFYARELKVVPKK
jgi:hypothetical protein